MHNLESCSLSSAVRARFKCRSSPGKYGPPSFTSPGLTHVSWCLTSQCKRVSFPYIYMYRDIIHMVADFQLASGVCLSKERGDALLLRDIWGHVKFSLQEMASDV